jgi:PAS domain S-box-containing protein
VAEVDPSAQVTTRDDTLSAESVFHAMVENTTDLAFIVLDASGRVTSWNSGATHVLGFASDEMLGVPFAELETHDRAEDGGLRRAMAEATRTGSAPFGGWIRCRDGSTIWAHAVATAVRTPSGDLAGFGLLLRDYTSQKVTEQLLAHEHMRREDLFLQAPAAIAIIRGPDHVFELLNPFAETVIGRTAAEVLGRAGREALPEFVDQGIWDLFDRVYATGAPFVGEEYPIKIDRTGNGQLHESYFNFVVQPTFNLEGDVDGALIHAVDVTDQVLSRRRVEQLAAQIEHERARLAFSQRAGKIGTFEWDLRTGHLLWTPELEELYGLAPGEFGGTYESWRELIHPDDRPPGPPDWTAIASMGSSIGEFRVIRPDGSTVWLASRGNVESDADGTPIRLVGVNVDITDRKQIELNLRFLAEAGSVLSSSLDYEKTLESVAFLAVPAIADWATIHMLDEHGALKRVTLAHADPSKLAAAIESSRDEIDLSSDFGLGHILRTGRTEFYSRIGEDLLRHAARDEDELERLRSIGFTSVIMAPIHSADRPIGVITLVSAESRRTYTEADRAMVESLASRASLAIQNARLYQDARNAVALRDDFISIASHELKTPLTSLKIYAQVLHRQLTSGDLDRSMAGDRLGRMEMQIDRLAKLVGDLLDISRIRGGQLQYQMREFDLTALVREIVEAPRPVEDRHAITLSSPPHPVIVRGDRERLGQVLTNLLSNALKYSPPHGDIMVTVDSGADSARVAVQDFGYGIAPDDLPHIFERFYRVSSADRVDVPGLGMGLYLSREIARRHDGDITVHSEIGKGSTFTLSVPLAAAQSASG